MPCNPALFCDSLEKILGAAFRDGSESFLSRQVRRRMVLETHGAINSTDTFTRNPHTSPEWMMRADVSDVEVGSPAESRALEWTPRRPKPER